ncbi:MAG: DUF3109 family protein [Bacteroidetes bacterium]|nr:MAG: DUF3109 family protein [Bacteroidota bacterium]
MLVIQEVLVSDDVVKENFICNLKACKGICCVEGDYGAPLDTSELHTLEHIYERVRPFLAADGIKALEEQGLFVFVDETKEYTTPLIDGGPCAYRVIEGGIITCGIELAYYAGEVPFKKPISCHLYPIRIRENSKTGFEAINYDRWEICSDACTLGNKEQVPVYKFLKEAIIRKYGEEFYAELEAAANYLESTDHGK